MGSMINAPGREPIAIIGLSCKFAGSASTPENLWEMLAEGRNAWSEIPTSRFNAKGTHHPNHEKLNTTNAKGAHFIEEDVGLFDAAFFNFSAETASALDPQFRLQLESAYEALENAGLPLSRIRNSNTSVYAGVFAHDYHEGLIRDEDQLPRFLPIGTFSAMSSNRISHFFDLRGASMTIDTGCSTTLVALHQAVNSLRNRESDMSIVSGANLLLTPDMFKVFGSLGMLSPDGKSYAFDSRANGYGRGEGVATIVIKRLDDALACGDPVRAVIRETFLNQDGKTETITTPSQAAQEELMHECYRRAGLDPRDTQYFEAHGTGTPTGDPIEARAIAAVFGGSHRQEPLRIGSLKTNIGHTEAVSGLAGLIKVVLALEKNQIPPSINFEKPNPKLALENWGLEVATSLEPWPSSNPHQPRRASLNNFGFGGSNSHVILEGAESFVSRPGRSERGVKTDDSGTVLVFSGRDEKACQRMVSNVKEYLQSHKTTQVSELVRNLSYTLGNRRTLFPWVAAGLVRVQNDSMGAIIQALESPSFAPVRTLSRRPRIGMIFTGQGAQWHAMGRELMDLYPVFTSSLKESERHLKTLGAKWSLLEEMQRSEQTSRVNSTELSIPICVALQIALVRLLESWGIMPTAVVSHSSGEIAAAYAAGALTLGQAMAAAHYRAALAADPNMRLVGEKGGMLAIGLGATEAQEYVDNLATSGKAVVACINSPESVTIAGDVSAVEELEEVCKQLSIFSRRLRVDTGYHSHHMQPIAGPYLELLRQHMPDVVDDDEEPDPDTPTVAFSSAVTGGRIDSLRQIASPEHWVDSLLQPVQFVEAVIDMILGDHGESGGSNVDVLLEVGPHTALAAPVREILSMANFEGLDIPYYGCLTRKEPAGDTMRTTAVNLLLEGLPLDMHRINFPVGASQLRVLTDLPSYPWNHNNRHWQESRLNRSIRAREQQPHALLGSLVPSINTETSTHWRNILRVGDSPWLRDHVIQDNIVYPGAGYVCLVIEAAKQLAAIESTSTTKEITGYRLRDVELLAALVVPDDSNGIEVQTKLYQADARIIGARGWRQFEITSATLESRWTLHAKGLVMVEFDDTPESESKLELRPLSGYTRHVDPEDMFSSLRSRGIYHGPLFQNTLRIEQDGREDRSVSHVAIADTSVPDDLPSNTVLHPTTLDSVILSSYSALPGVGSEENDAKLPYSISSLWVSNNISHEAGHAFQCHTSLSHKTARNFRADAIVYDEHVSGARRRLLEMQGLVCQSMGRSRANLTDKSHNKWEEELCTKIEWAPDLSLRQPKAVEKFKQQHARPATDIDKEVVIRLRRVSVYFCHDVLKGLTNEDIAQLEPHHKKFLRWMQDQIDLAASGQQGPGSEKWTSDGTTTREREIALAAKQSVEGEMVCHLGPKTLAILRQERPALEVMMEDRLLYRYYAEAFRMGPSLVQLAALLRQVVHKNPRARILEIGGGTGGATRHMLKAIGTAADGGPRAASWHFTDISSGFFEAARTEFAEWSEILKFDKLDIEKDPATQGFDLASYDIVVACEVLHATKSMARTMANVHSLMKPGGTLLMMETTQDQVDIQYTFGLLPGWWLSEEPQRQSSPSLTIPFFDPVLKEAGFSGVDLDIRDCESDDMYSISVIMTRAEAEQNQASSRYSEDTTIVISRKVPPPSWMIDSLKGAIRASTGGAAPAVFSLEDVTDGNAYTGKICVFLGDIMQPILPSIDQGTFEAIKAMTNNCKGLLWVSVSGAVECASPDSSLSHGLLRTLRNEFLGRRYISLDLEGPIATSSLSSSAVSTITNVIELGFNHAQAENSSPFDFEYAERDGILLVPRLFKDRERNQLVAPQPALEWDQPEAILSEERFLQQDRPLRLEVGIDGLLDTLAFGDYDVESKSPLAPDMVEIEPRAYGLNFRDVMVAMGQLKERVMGLECSGVITCLGTEAQGKGFKVGDPVIALLLGPFASRAQIPWHGVVHMPQNMSFEDAASVPMVFGTAYVGLVDTARFRPGQSILIHSAAGGVGQAAIMLAKHLGAGEIFVTVSSQEKRELMSRQYGIPDDHIFSSRNLSFAPAILAATNGRGVDVVLNSLAGPLLQASFDVLATFGHLVEIGKKDLEGDSLLGMGTFSRVASYSSLDMMTLLRCRGNDIHRVLSDISRLMQEEVLKPVYPCTVYSIGDVTKAFRLLQTGKHMGKIVLSIKPNDMVMVRPRVAIAARLRPDASYLLVGGIGGLGRSIAHWLVSHGAKNLIVMSRSAGNVRKSGAFVAELRGAGCRVQAISCDVTKAGDLAKAVRTCEKEGLPPVRGVVQGAMVLQDSVFEHMTLDDWQTCIGPKVDSTRNLHVQWSQPGSLDFFVMLSSFSGILGIVSQANYAAGSAYQDAMARWRSARGLPGVSVDLGAVKGVGYVAETAGVADRMRAAGETLMLEEKAVHRALQAAIAHPTGQPQILLGLNTGPGPQWDEQGKSQMSRDARFLPLRYRAHQSEESGMKQDLPAGGSDGHTLAGKLAGAESAETAAGLVGEAIAAKLAVIFMLPAQEIDLTQPPAQYGIDSLVAVELRNMLMLQAGAEVSIFNIIQSVSLAALALQVVAKSRFIPSQDAPAFGIEAR